MTLNLPVKKHSLTTTGFHPDSESTKDHSQNKNGGPN
jgi:hypothetical protein